MHMGFQIKAPVLSGDKEYIVVVASEDVTADLALNVAFQGAIADTTEPRNRFVDTNGAQDIAPITITAPGLLTVETTQAARIRSGRLRTPLILRSSRYAESGGSGGNFQFVVPVNADSFPATYRCGSRGANPQDDRGVHLGHGLQSRWGGDGCNGSTLQVIL